MYSLKYILKKYAKWVKPHDSFLHHVTKFWILKCKKAPDYTKNVEILQKSGIIKSTKSRMPLPL